MKRILGLIGVVCAASLALLVTSSARGHDAPLPASGPVAFDATIPAALEVKRAPTGHLLVKPRINGKDAGWFIFDTGAGICCVDPKRVEELGLTEVGTIDSEGVGGAKDAEKLVRTTSLTLGPATFSDHVMMVTDFSFLTAHLGEEISGVIGYGVLSECVVEMDLREGRIGIHVPDDAAIRDLGWQELVVQDRVPAVRAKFEDHEGLFRLDTGSSGHVTFHQGAVKKWELLEGRTLTDSKIAGVGGMLPAKEGTLAWFELGGVRTENVPAKFALEAKGTMADSNKDGNIGVELLKPFTLYFDYKNLRMAFVKRAG